jgi:UDP-N-acetylmuramoyl-tripeptide--D-alanyl-D-alanine ligase
MISVEELYSIYLRHPSIQTDSRKLQPNDLFFALKGARFNGNHYASQALEKGAACAVVDEPVTVVSDRIILVDDVLDTLQQLAKYHRLQFDIPIIAITGSNGKTTTKDLIHAVLSSALKTYTTQGNLNNHIGIPITILRIEKDAAVAVIEMGANHRQEIAGYCQYTMPTHGIITNTGKAHLEGFGGVEGVRKGKGELFDYLRYNKGTAFVMWDYDYLREMSMGLTHIISYGTSDAAVTGMITSTQPFIDIEMTKGTTIKNIFTHLVGSYNLPNVLAAVCVGKYFNIPDENIKTAIENYSPSSSRSQLIEKNSNKIILDAYNANPTSMKAAIENFEKIQAPTKILILGSMAELGGDSIKEHQNIIELINQYQWDKVVLVGGDFLKIHHPYISQENSLQTKEWFLQENVHDAYILIKGSRSMQMERVIQ